MSMALYCFTQFINTLAILLKILLITKILRCTVCIENLKLSCISVLYNSSLQRDGLRTALSFFQRSLVNSISITISGLVRFKLWYCSLELCHGLCQMLSTQISQTRASKFLSNAWFSIFHFYNGSVIYSQQSHINFAVFVFPQRSSSVFNPDIQRRVSFFEQRYFFKMLRMKEKDLI